MSNTINYDYPFINQYIKIPQVITDKVRLIYSPEKTQIQYCVSLIVTNLLVFGTVAYSQSGNYYIKNGTKNYTKLYFLRARDILVNDKYIFKSKAGSKNIKFNKGIASRITYLEKLTDIFPDVKYELELKLLPLLTLDDVQILNVKNLVPFFYIPITPIQATSTSSSSFSNIYSTLPLRHILAMSRALNRDYFNKITLDFSKLKLSNPYLGQVGLTRVFTNGECGRWYQKGGYSYQQLPETERLQILMNGMEVGELDYSAMHPNILYTWVKQQAPANFYQLVIDELIKQGYKNVTKFIVKHLVLMCINSKNLAALSSAINLNNVEETNANARRAKEGRALKPVLYQAMKQIGLKPKTVVGAFKIAHPPIATYAYSASANKLMLEESGILTDVLLVLKKRGIPSAPIHDSLLFPKHKKDKVKQIMLDCYKKKTGFDIQVK